MKRVYIMRGVPGSGKDYNADIILSRMKKKSHSTIKISADQYFEDENGNYNWDGKLMGEAHIECMRRFLNAVQENNINVIVVANTNTMNWEYSPYVSVALAVGYEVRIILLDVDPEIAFERQIHNVPKEHHSRMHNRFEPGLPQHKKITRVQN